MRPFTMGVIGGLIFARAGPVFAQPLRDLRINSVEQLLLYRAEFNDTF